MAVAPSSCGAAGLGGAPGAGQENVVQKRTFSLLAEREALQKDKEFLQHYARVATQSAAMQEARSAEAARAVTEQEGLWREVHEELQAARARFAAHRQEFWALCMQVQRLEVVSIDAQRRAGADEMAFRQRLDVAGRLGREDFARAIGLERDLATARAELEAQAHSARASLLRAEAAELALEQARLESNTRDEVAAVAVQQALSRLETDMGRERQVLLARERSRFNRIQELQSVLDGTFGGTLPRIAPATLPAGAMYGGRSTVEDSYVYDAVSPPMPSLPPSPLGRLRGQVAEGASRMFNELSERSAMRAPSPGRSSVHYVRAA